MNAIELYRELVRALGLDRAPNPDLEVAGVVGLYVLAVFWLGRLWFTRRNVRRRRQLARGLAVMDGVAALLRVIVLGGRPARPRPSRRSPALLPLVGLRAGSMTAIVRRRDSNGDTGSEAPNGH